MLSFFAFHGVFVLVFMVASGVNNVDNVKITSGDEVAVLGCSYDIANGKRRQNYSFCFTVRWQ